MLLLEILTFDFDNERLKRSLNYIKSLYLKSSQFIVKSSSWKNELM